MKKAERERIHQMFGGRCAYCGCEITVKSMHVDHVDPIKRMNIWNSQKGRHEDTGYRHWEFNERPENLFPACAPCNLWKHSMSLEDFRHSVMTQIDKIQKTSCGFRLLMRFGIISTNKIPQQFYFETYRAASRDEE